MKDVIVIMKEIIMKKIINKSIIMINIIIRNVIIRSSIMKNVIMKCTYYLFGLTLLFAIAIISSPIVTNNCFAAKKSNKQTNRNQERNFSNEQTGFNQSQSNINDYELGKRYIKLGNSYREVKMYECALHYVNYGMLIFYQQRNFDEKYWYAVGKEYLGYCIRDMGNYLEACYLFEEALAIYSSILSMEYGSQYILNQQIKNMEQELHLLKKHLPSASNNDRSIVRTNNREVSNNYINNIIAGINVNNCNAHDNFNDNANDFVDNTNNDINNIPVNSSQQQFGSFVVNLDNMRLTKFPDNFTKNRIDNISIVRNRFTSFPDEVLRYRTLKTINASFNRIANFPDLSRLQELEYLDLSNNKISEVDGTVGNLRNLKYLNLSNNTKLKNISLDIGKLRNSLQELDIRNTRINERLIRQLIRELPNTNILVGTERRQSQNQNFDFNRDIFEE